MFMVQRAILDTKYISEPRHMSHQTFFSDTDFSPYPPKWQHWQVLEPNHTLTSIRRWRHCGNIQIFENYLILASVILGVKIYSKTSTFDPFWNLFGSKERTKLYFLIGSIWLSPKNFYLVVWDLKRTLTPTEIKNFHVMTKVWPIADATVPNMLRIIWFTSRNKQNKHAPIALESKKFEAYTRPDFSMGFRISVSMIF